MGRLAQKTAFPLTSGAVKKNSYPTPQDAEAAFYEALESCDLDAMMEVWADDEEIVCVHPGGPRLSGYDQVRASWAKILGSGQRLNVQLSEQVTMQGIMFSVHSVHERIAGQGKADHLVVATNIFLRTTGGWRMIARHGSSAPQAARSSEGISKTLH
jgi:ketosteroid isomerase-like protein